MVRIKDRLFRFASLSSRIAIVIILLLVVLRLFLPTLVLKQVNKVLNRLPEYSSTIADLDIALIRGAYIIRGFKMSKRDDPSGPAFISIPTTDLSIEWGALFRGKLVGEIEFDKPVVNLVASENEKDEQLSTDGNWKDMVKDLFPLEINRTSIEDATIRYRHQGKKDGVSLFAERLDAEIDGLTNKVNKGDSLPAQAKVSARLQGISEAILNAKFDPLATKPTFIADLTTGIIPLKSFNAFSAKTLGIDFEEGSLQIFAEADCKNSKISGYVKPIMKDVKILSLTNDSSNPLYLIWEGLFSLITEIFTNQRHDQFAAKIPLEGKFEKIDTDNFKIIGTILHNAFIKALKGDINNKDQP